MAKKQGRGGVYQPTAAEIDWILPDLRPLAVPIDSIQLDPANENRHDDASVAAIAASLKRYGQRSPLVVNRATGYIAKGNGTWQAARSLGHTQIAVVRVDDDPTTHTGYRLADNRTAQLSSWDEERLALSIATLTESDADLAAALQLDRLAANLAPAADPPAIAVPQVHALQIECRDEAHQKILFEQFQREGLTCKVLTL